jgi:hypothetical protein
MTEKESLEILSILNAMSLGLAAAASRVKSSIAVDLPIPTEAVRPQSDLVGMAEACGILGVGPGKMYEMCRNSLLPSPLKFNRKPMWPRPAVNALAARLGGSK